MTQKDQDQLKSSVDHLLLQAALNTARLKALTEMVIGVYAQTLPPESVRNNINAFYDLLQAESRDALNSVENAMFLSKRALIVTMDTQLSLDQEKNRHLARIAGD